jgi:radical SAM superfamily enzyme YgiQ (UPF0313 family)
MSSRGLKDAIKVSKLLKQQNYPVVWGGQLPSMQPELVLNSDYVDLISFGEGEETWLELVSCIKSGKDYHNIKGIAYKKDGKIIHNECRPFFDLKDMPVSDCRFLMCQSICSLILDAAE